MDPMGNICKKYFYMKSQNLLTANLDGMFLGLCSNKCVGFFYVNLKCHCRTKFKYRNLWESKGIFFVSGTRNLSEPKMYINNHWMIPCGDCNPRWQPLQGNFDIGSYGKIFWIILICTIVFSLHIFRKKPS